MMMMEGEVFGKLGTALTGLMIIWAMFKQYFPFRIRDEIEKYAHKLVSLVYPYVRITFHEFPGDGFERSKAYTNIERYLGTNSTTTAKRLRADMVSDSHSLVLGMDDHEEISDHFRGIKIWWASSKNLPINQTISFYPNEEERRYYALSFHKKHRETITKLYLKHVMEEGKAIAVKNRVRKLHTNNKSEHWHGYKRSTWSHVTFEHPATFQTLAMDPKEKQAIIDDLLTFQNGKNYYAKIGKAWKRGYLLYGPPGTGKSTMIAAMANLMDYDIYDLELTSVKNNTELRKLLIDTTSKSIIVIEDIDCSLDLTGQRKKDKEEKKEEEDPRKKMTEPDYQKKESEVTLSGLLNFIDGLWSACAGERLIVFTTNFVDKLDPALIRRGRMDKKIELSYCGFEAFKVLAKNYLDIESHHLFPTVRRLLEETDMTPADVAENLMPKSREENAETCVENLIKELEMAKEKARRKAEEEEEEKKRKKEEEEVKKGKKEEEEKKGKKEEEEEEEEEKKGKKEEDEEAEKKGKKDEEE
ncbi:AAA-ATPase ASD, mitochondrial-like [Diospyros lotus]|uniref:AAA-ATPase ASD, mitochondrial-like n=1 Tax=Diospyros lotus TaxID=55363 RepID=UPI00224F6DCD|nr:AAA-ATPase ASD, mitochondrial-like [Diospyros lotus]